MALSDKKRRDVVLSALMAVRPDLDASKITDDTRLMRGLGCASIDGVDLAVELEQRLGISIPNTVNPLVQEDDGKKRDRTFAEMVAWTETMSANGAKV